jgi:hypothetical protein
MVIMLSGCNGKRNVGYVEISEGGYDLVTRPNNGPFGSLRLAPGYLFLKGSGDIFQSESVFVGSSDDHDLDSVFENGYVVVDPDLKWFEIRLIIESREYYYNGRYKNDGSN